MLGYLIGPGSSLRRVENDLPGSSISVVVVASYSKVAAELTRQSIDNPAVEVVIVSSCDYDVSALRRAGVSQTSGEIVAFVEDCCVAQPS